MAEECADFDYPPRAYKTVPELQLPENEHIKYARINSLREIHEVVHHSTEGSKIAQFFSGKSVFITGATGFLGKLLTEKLLRTCKDIETVYLLVRPRKGKDVVSRIDETFNDLIFSELEKAQPKFRHKIVPIRGDVSLPGLGIDIMDRQTMIEKVDVIFHVAATVRFDEKIRLATSINVCGTNEIMVLAQQCRKLCSLLYVSTAYSQNPHMVIGEKFYKPAYTYDQITKIVETNGDKFLTKNTKLLTREWPNTYSFTKAIAECVVRDMANDIPTCIYRPGIVISTHQEPLRAWINNLYGPMGAVVGAGTGILKSFYGDRSKVADLIPGDKVVNGMIAAAYNNQFNEKGDVKIYNQISSTDNPITWGDFHDLSSYYGIQNPTIKSIWYYCNSINNNIWLHLISILFLHFIPAFFMDLYLVFQGRRRRMVDIYKKAYKFNKVLAPFCTREWKFYNGNIRNLWDRLSDTDKKLFNFSMANPDFNWNDYLTIMGGGVRLYLVKDDHSTIPAALKKYKRLYYYHIITKGVFYLVVLRVSIWILSSLINLIR